MAGVGAFVPGGQYNQFNTSADQYRLNDLPPDIAVEEQALNRRQQIANLLMSHATQPIQTGQMAGRFFVPPSWAQGANQLGQALAGTYLTNVNDESRQNLSAQNQQQTAQAIQDYIQKTSPQRVTTPAQTTTTELEGPGAPVPTGIQPGEGFTPEQLAQPTANYGSLKEALVSLHDKRSKAFFQEGERPTSTTTIPGTTTMVPRTPEELQQAQLMAMTSNVKGLQDYAKTKAQMEQQSKEHALALDVRRETAAENVALRLEQMKQTAALTQGNIDARERAGMDANELKRDLANQANAIKLLEIETRREATQIGKTPPGYRTTAEGNLEAIPGGPADLKQQGVLNQDTAILGSSNAAFDRLSTAANALLSHPGLAGIVGTRGKIPNFPGSAAADAEAQLNTLKSQIGFGALQELRNNSKTGSSGLGALSDAEGKRLESIIAPLDKAQSYDQMKSALEAVRDYGIGAKERMQDAFNMKHKNAPIQTGSPAGGTGSPAALPEGAKQIGTSGGKPVYELPDGSKVIAQ